MLNVVNVKASTLPDLWFRALYEILEHGRRFEVDRGSYAGTTRLEFDYFFGHVKNPSYGSGTPMILPDIPPHFNIPNPADVDYVYGGPEYNRSYVEYVMTPTKIGNESYTYGERLTRARLTEGMNHHYDLGHKEIVETELAKGKSNIVWVEWRDTYVNQIEWIIECYKTKGHRNNQMVLQVAGIIKSRS